MTTSWRNSKARLIIIQDLEEKLLPLDENEMSAKEAWDTIYQYIAEFANVPFHQFKAHLNDHRKQVRARLEISFTEEMALAHDRLLHPRKTHNHRGEQVFDYSPAKQCLRDDVKNKVHTTMSALELQATRPEYQSFKPNKFRDRISQEVRRQKFLNYLELQRAKKFEFEEKQGTKFEENQGTKTKATKREMPRDAAGISGGGDKEW
jgi:hypothetical protein